MKVEKNLRISNQFYPMHNGKTTEKSIIQTLIGSTADAKYKVIIGRPHSHKNYRLPRE